MGKHLTPLMVCERLIGPIETIGPIVGYTDKAAYNWRRGSSANDPGDIPSARNMRKLLAHSKSRGLGLTPEHLIRGASETEIDAILAQRKAAA